MYFVTGSSPLRVCISVLKRLFLHREGWKPYCFKEAPEEEKIGAVIKLDSLIGNVQITLKQTFHNLMGFPTMQSVFLCYYSPFVSLSIFIFSANCLAYYMASTKPNPEI